MKAALLSGIVFLALGFFAHADIFDDQLENLRKGKKMDLSPDDFAAATKKAFETYEKTPDDPEAMADIYMAQVKWSILDEERHGGWPVRSWLIMEEPKRKILFKTLKARFEKNSDAITAYCLLPSALFEKDAELGQKLMTTVKEKDEFLAKKLLKAGEFWTTWVKQVQQSK